MRRAVGLLAAAGLMAVTAARGDPAAWAAPNLESVEQMFTQVATAVGNAVVSISTERSSRARQFVRQHGDASFDQYLRDVLFANVPLDEMAQMGLGSGVIIDPTGVILTNHHVVSGAQKIIVTLADGRSASAAIMGVDARLDLAVLRIKGTDLPALPFADSDLVLAGQWALAVGNPLGFMTPNPRPTVSVGVVSAVHRGLPRAVEGQRARIDLIQTDAEINPGNSGGPLVNSRGEILGINVFLGADERAAAAPVSGFAIPANDARRLVTHILQGGQVLSGWLGIKVQDLNVALADYFGLSKPQGVLVSEVLPESPAYRAGLQEKDIITKFNNERIADANDFFRFTERSAVGETIQLKIFRNSLLSTVTVKAGQQPAQIRAEVTAAAVSQGGAPTERMQWRGMELVPAPEGTGGVSVSAVKSDSPASQAGITAGDIVTQINARPIAALTDVQALIAEIHGNALIKTSRGYIIVGE